MSFTSQIIRIKFYVEEFALAREIVEESNGMLECVASGGKVFCLIIY